jgi:AraC family transcriptional regulator, transcriptional activator of pobA
VVRRLRQEGAGNVRAEDECGRRGPIFAGRAVSFSQNLHGAVSHDYAVLAFYVHGRSRLQLRGTWDVEPGAVLIVPAGEPHRVFAKDGSDFWGVGFCVPCLDADTTAALAAPFERVRHGAAPVVQIPVARRAFLESLFQELSEPEAPGNTPLVYQSLLTLIVREVTRAAAWVGERGAEAGLVTESLRFIERHCLEPLTLREVAAAVGRTPSHVTTALKRATGRTAVEWIIAGRMGEARRRLLHSDERVDVIAERVGYADVTHFIRLFRRAHGATPAAWRSARRRSA